MSAIEKLRNKNIEDNKRILAELGFAYFLPKASKVTLKKNKLPEKTTEKQKPAQKRKLEVREEELGSIHKRRRRSARIQGKEADALALEDEQSDSDEVKPSPKVFRPHSYGAIEGVEVGSTWMMRIDCSKDGIHRPTVAGIHGGPEGAYSIALSGGYDDNIDLGEGFTYTGEGGRDLKGTKANPKNLRTAPQSKDQTLTRGNLALSKNVETKQPVRVIRGYKLSSPFAPEEGYRYDGLYSVEKSWFTTGLSGFGVWKFALKRCPNQAPPPWTVNEPKLGGDSTDEEKSTTESDGQMKENGTRNQTESKELEEIPDSLTDTASSSTDEQDIMDSKNILNENNVKTIYGSFEEEEEKKTTEDINGSPKKQSNGKDTDTEDKNTSDVINDSEKMEDSTPDKSPSANKENERIGTGKPDDDQRTIKHENDSKVLKCGTDGIPTENESKTLLGSSTKKGSTGATLDKLTTEDNCER